MKYIYIRLLSTYHLFIIHFVFTYYFSIIDLVILRGTTEASSQSQILIAVAWALPYHIISYNLCVRKHLPGVRKHLLGAECAARGSWILRGRIYLLVVRQHLLCARIEEHLPGVLTHLLGYGNVR